MSDLVFPDNSMEHYTVASYKIESPVLAQVIEEIKNELTGLLLWKEFTTDGRFDVIICAGNIMCSEIESLSKASQRLLWLFDNVCVDGPIPKNIDFIPLRVNKEYLISKLVSMVDSFMQFDNLAGKSTTNSIMIFDAEGTPLWVNQGFTRIYGYTLDEFIRIFPNYFDASVVSDSREHFNRLLNNEIVEYTSYCINKENQKKWLQTNMTPVFSSNGKLSRFVVVETDITSLKEIEESLASKNEHTRVLAEHLEEVNKSLEEGQREIEKQRQLLEIEKQRSDELLHNILPEVVAHKLKKGKVKPKLYKSVTIMFADIKGFSKLCRLHDSIEIVEQLDYLIGQFDDIIGKHFIEKIKTIGDAYMCAGGIPMKNNSHQINVVLAALEIQNFLWEYNKPRILNLEYPWDCRIGIHTGEVIAGVVGKKKFAYDIWGDAVNVAARMEQAGVVNSVNISVDTYDLIKDYFECIPRGFVEAKNIGQVEMFFVKGLKPEYSTDATGVFPNETFLDILRKM